MVRCRARCGAEQAQATATMTANDGDCTIKPGLGRNIFVMGQANWSDLPTGHMAGSLYSPHLAAATRLRPPGCGHLVAGLGLAVFGAACLKLHVRPTHCHYHYHCYLHPHLLTRRYSLRHPTWHLHIADRRIRSRKLSTEYHLVWGRCKYRLRSLSDKDTH